MSNPELRRRLMEHAARRHGIFTFHEWQAVGLTPTELRSEMRRGAIDRIHPTVYRVVGTPWSWRGELMAAVAGGGADALASHRAAVPLWALAGATGRSIELLTPRHLRVVRRGVRVHECVDLPTQDRWEIDGIPVTGIHRTLLNACRYSVKERAGDYLDDAVRRELTTYEATSAWLEGVARRGVRGVVRLRGLLAERPGGTVVPGSTFESRMLRLISRYDLPAPERQFRVVSGKHEFALDFAWPEQRVGVEADGQEFHTLTSQIEHDHWRQNLIQLQEWLLLRYTPTALRLRPRETADEIRSALSGATDGRMRS